MSKSKKPVSKSVKKPVAKASSTKAKVAPAKKTPAKPAPKTPAPAAKKPAKPVPVKKSAPVKTPAKAAAKAPAKKPAVKPAPEKKAVAPAKPAPVAKKAAPSPEPKAAKKKAPVMDHAVAVKTLNEHREKHGHESPTKRAKRSAPVAFSLADIDEYLKVRRNARINEYVPGQEEPVKAGKSGAKVAPKVEDVPVKNRQVAAVSVADLLGFNPFAKKGDATPEEELIPQKFRKYYKLLLELRDHVNEGLATHTEEALKKTGKEDTGDVSAYSQHMADAGTDSFDRDFALSLVNNEQEALYEIADAIDRMKDGSYGVCEITQKPIPHDRLVAVPFTRYSAEGQRQVEKTRRTRGGRRTGGNPMLEINEGVGFGTAGGEEGGDDDH